MRAGHAVNVEEVVYRAHGHEVSGRLYSPSNVGRPTPAVVLCPGRTRDIDGLEFLCTGLARSGIAVLATKYRGMDFFSDDEDVIAGIDFLADRPSIDRDRIGLVGHSRGGMASLRCAAKDRRINSVVAIQPPVEFSRYMKAMALLSPVRYQGLLGSLGGTEEEVPERYVAIAALSYADRIQIPALLICGTQDLHAPADHSYWMHEALKKSGNSRAQIAVLQDVGHFFEKMYSGYDFNRVLELSEQWLQDTLGSSVEARPR